MTGPDDRRSFSSRTPANDNPERVTYRRGFVTRHQVWGWRFMMRRIASGVALHDTRMLVDPLRTQSRAVLTGALILITGVAGCFVFSLIRPSGSAGTDAVVESNPLRCSHFDAFRFFTEPAARRNAPRRTPRPSSPRRAARAARRRRR